MITIQKAVLSDAAKLTEIMKKTFDEEARKWLPNQDIVDYNILPPGYASVEVTKYMIEELVYYKIVYHNEIVGGITVTVMGKSYGRIDRIYVDPDYQGKKIGSTAIELIEAEFPTVTTWDLETSSRQLNNHHFYKKMGYQIDYTTEDEYGYIKRKERSLSIENVVENKDISNTLYDNCNMEKTECYQVDLEGSCYSNSNLMNTQYSNCNVSHAKFQNINFKHSFFADLNLSYSKMRFVTLGGVRFIDTTIGEQQEPISFERCDLQGTQISDSNLRNLQITNSDITGMTIDNIPVEKLLEAYYQNTKK
jgi:GNAT superfamily N-acetyltransferase